MKRSLYILGVVVVLMVASSAMAQTSASANANANIVAQIAIANSAPLEFGNIVGTTGGGTVTVPATATPTRTFGGTATGASGTTITAATFTVTGATGAGWTLSSPPATVSLTGPGTAMSAALNYSATSGTLTGGTATFYVGGVLTLNATQTAGAYTGSFSVTAAYN